VEASHAACGRPLLDDEAKVVQAVAMEPRHHLQQRREALTVTLLEIGECPLANLPEARSGRWGQGLTKAKMAERQWLKPVLLDQFEFLEWTGDNHLRHSKFIGLREDKQAKDVVRE
jgi:bifunctional non-homologous end joining protein LigD